MMMWMMVMMVVTVMITSDDDDDESSVLGWRRCLRGHQSSKIDEIISSIIPFMSFNISWSVYVCSKINNLNYK
jgi:hypothetical protein